MTDSTNQNQFIIGSSTTVSSSGTDNGGTPQGSSRNDDGTPSGGSGTENGSPNPQPQPHTTEKKSAKAKALEEKIGERGKTPVNSSNRGDVKKWLSENGVPFSNLLPSGENVGCGYLGTKALDKAYNDTTDETLNELRGSKPEGNPEGNPDDSQTKSESDKSDSESDSESDSQTKSESGESDKSDNQTKSDGKKSGESDGSPDEKKKKKKKDIIKKHKLHDGVKEVLEVGIGVLVFGPAGSGKTTLAKNVAEDLGIPFFMNGAIGKEHKLFGFIDANGKYHSTQFRQAFEKGGLYLFDEIDASNPQVLLTLNSALANGICDFPDCTLKMHPSFRFIASANTNGNGATAQYSARNQLDGATKDRFMVFKSEYDDNLTLDIIKSMVSNPEDLKIALEWNDKVLQIRRICHKQSIDLILSPRASFNGVRCLTNPNRKVFKKVKDLLDALVFNKISNPDTVTRLKNVLKEEENQPDSSTSTEETVVQ